MSSNALQYNAPDTIDFQQARSIQELARRNSEKLRALHWSLVPFVDCMCLYGLGGGSDETWLCKKSGTICCKCWSCWLENCIQCQVPGLRAWTSTTPPGQEFTLQHKADPELYNPT